MSDRTLKRLLILAAVLAAFAPALSAGFVGWDDRPFILDNPFIRGLTWPHLRAMAGASVGGVWMPLTWLSLAVDHSFWGLDPAGYHLTNLLLHAAAALLFYETCRLLLPEDEWTPLFAALFFAIHPLRVESVAWVAERKGVLAGSLCIASLYARLRSFESPRRGAWEGAALAAFALSLTAKPNGLTFPLALIALEALHLRRRPTVRAYAPYFALSAAALGATLFAMDNAGATGAVHTRSAGSIAGQALYGLVFYPWKTLWPSGLAAYYPPRAWFGSWSWESAACAAGIAAACWALRVRRAAAAAAACYALLMIPMLGFVQHGLPFAAADRFSYLPCLGFAVLFGAASGGGPARRSLAAACLLALGIATWRQCFVWRDSLSLWSAAADRAPSALAEANLGGFLVKAGRVEEGIERLRAAVARDPSRAIAHEALGSALSLAGLEIEAREAWRAGLAASPSPEISALLGASISKVNASAALEGAALLREAIAKHPGRAPWRADLADALLRSGDEAEAARAYEEALALEPALGRAHVNLGLILDRAGRAKEAAAHYRLALRDGAVRAQAHHNWGNLLLREGRTERAEAHYRRAARLDPLLFQSRINLGNILVRRGRMAEAAALYREALKTHPGSVEARANLGAIAPFLRK